MNYARKNENKLILIEFYKSKSIFVLDNSFPFSNTFNIFAHLSAKKKILIPCQTRHHACIGHCGQVLFQSS